MRLTRLLAFAALLVLLVPASSAAARKPSTKKAMWGPAFVDGKSQFPIYRDLGVGIYQMQLRWNEVATTRPIDPTNPNDPAYAWPPQMDATLAQAKKYGVKVLVMLFGTPGWANGGKDFRWMPNNPQDFADFATAASKRWPGVKYWMIWGEPCRGDNFRPLVGEPAGHYTERLDAAQRVAPQNYARLLDAAYGALKHVQRSDLVVGGNCFTGTTSTLRTDIGPFNWMRYLRLPNGKRPRMDLYGHNAISARRPDLRRPEVAPGAADFSDLDLFAKWLDRYIRPGIKIFNSEFVLPTDHFGAEATFYVSRRTAASWTRDALRIARHFKRLYSFGWFTLYDDPPNASGDENTYGLLDYRGHKKPAYYAFRDG